MKNKITLYIKTLCLAVVAMCVFSPLMAFAQAAVATVTEPGSIQDALALLPMVISTIKNGSYLLASAFITLITVWVLRAYLLPKWVNNAWYAILTQFLGLLVGVAISIIGGATSQEASLALLSGPLAATFWSTVAKYFLAKYLPQKS